MDVYKTLKFGNEAQTMFYFALGIFGVQIMQHAFNCATMSTAGASPKAAGVACLANAAMWFLFAFIDGIRIPLGTLPPFMPKESIMANMVIQCAIGAVNVAGWIGAGKPVALPALPVGSLATPMIAMMANLAFFAIGCAAFTRPFLDMFVPASPWPPRADVRRGLIFFNAGVMMLGNTAATMMISNAEPGTPDTNYRLLRANLYAMFFYMGKFSTEAVVNKTGWPQPCPSRPSSRASPSSSSPPPSSGGTPSPSRKPPTRKRRKRPSDDDRVERYRPRPETSSASRARIEARASALATAPRWAFLKKNHFDEKEKKSPARRLILAPAAGPLPYAHAHRYDPLVPRRHANTSLWELTSW